MNLSRIIFFILNHLFLPSNFIFQVWQVIVCFQMVVCTNFKISIQLLWRTVSLYHSLSTCWLIGKLWESFVFKFWNYEFVFFSQISLRFIWIFEFFLKVWYFLARILLILPVAFLTLIIISLKINAKVLFWLDNIGLLSYLCFSIIEIRFCHFLIVPRFNGHFLLELIILVIVFS